MINMRSILPQIEQLAIGINLSFQKVATFVLENKNSAAFLTLDEMSKQIGVSTTTVLRFARALDFKGYKDFQQQLRKELLVIISNYSSYNRLKTAYTTTSHKGDLIQEIMASDMKNVEKTLTNIDRDVLKGVIKTLCNAKGNIHVCGFGGTYAMAYLAYTRIIPLKSHVCLMRPEMGEVMDPLLDISKDDVCLFFTFHPYNETSTSVLRELRLHNAKIIIITDQPHDTIDKYADLLLTCEVETSAPKNSLTSVVSLINYICAAISFNDYENSLKKFAASKQLAKHYHVTIES